MASLRKTREALALRIREVVSPQLQAYAEPADTINAPCALILPPRGKFASYGQTLGITPVLGLPMAVQVTQAQCFYLDVLVIVPRTDIDRAQQDLDVWFGYEDEPGYTTSIVAAIDQDDTLGQAVEWCRATSADAYAPVEYNMAQYFGARIHFEIGLV